MEKLNLSREQELILNNLSISILEYELLEHLSQSISGNMHEDKAMHLFHIEREDSKNLLDQLDIEASSIVREVSKDSIDISVTMLAYISSVFNDDIELNRYLNYATYQYSNLDVLSRRILSEVPIFSLSNEEIGFIAENRNWRDKIIQNDFLLDDTSLFINDVMPMDKFLDVASDVTDVSELVWKILSVCKQTRMQISMAA
jgi:hypothetical protein